MLRLKPPGFERLLQSPVLQASFGGSEANVALSLAQFGLDTAFVTALPADNPLAEACLRTLRSYGVDTAFVARQGQRMGLYFLEAGANQRPSNVVYDRADSAMSSARIGDFDWGAIFEGAGWLHVSGITPAISAPAADLTLHALKMARKRGITVSCDFNYRQKLWQYGRSVQEVMSELIGYVDLLIANEQDCLKSLGISFDAEDFQGMDSGQGQDAARAEALAQKMFAVYPNLKFQAMTLRQNSSASHNRLSAFLYNGSQLFGSRPYEITAIVDRVGAGDAFAAGLIYGLYKGLQDREALEFATAAACLKHSIVGDANLATADEVRRLIDGDSSGEIQR